MWKVYRGELTNFFATLHEALQFARQFEWAQVADEIGFVRYTIHNYRAIKN